MSTFNLPDLGEGLAEAEIVQWHVKVGDQVRADQAMVSVETAKAVVEVPAPFSGVVTALHGQQGDIIATGAPLIDFDSGTVVGSMPALQEDLPPDVSAKPAAAAPVANGGTSSRVQAVPAARALAKRLGVELDQITGTGRGGLVTVEDVLARTPSPTTHSPSPAIEGAEPLRGMRRSMAQSMASSRDEVPGSTVCDDADIHAWAKRGDFMVRLMRAMVAAWRVEPALNAWYDSKRMARLLHDHVHLAVAVDTDEGLIVPVVRDLQAKNANELRESLAQQKQAARERRVRPEDLNGFTLMLSNFGTLAGRYGIPLVVPPAVAILGAGKVRDDAVVIDGVVTARRRMPLSLSFDHRCITGGEACRYLAAVITDLEKSE